VGKTAADGGFILIDVDTVARGKLSFRERVLR
jgi:hypothetical protein